MYNWDRYTQNFHTCVSDNLSIYSSSVPFPYSRDIHPYLSDCTIAMKRNLDDNNSYCHQEKHSIGACRSSVHYHYDREHGSVQVHMYFKLFSEKILVNFIDHRLFHFNIFGFVFY